MAARTHGVRARLFTCSALVAAVAAGASAREIEVRWVAGGGAAAAGYVAYLRTAEGAFGGGIDLGLPSADADGVYTDQIDGVPDEDVFVALTAYSDAGLTSTLSNELLFPLGAPPPDPNAVLITVTDGAANPVYDGSEGGVESLAGVDVAYAAEMDGRGRLSGSGAADLDGDGSFETPVRVKGRIKGKDQEISTKLTLRVRGSTGTGKTKLRSVARHEIDSLRAQDDGSVVTSGKVDGAPVREEASTSDPLDTQALGWTLWFLVDESGTSAKQAASGGVVYGEGHSVPLQGKARFDERDGTWKVRLRSSGEHKGVRVRIDDLSLASDREVLGGRMAYKAFGQKGAMDLPSGL
jgi:hypothetical protein